MNRVAVAVAVAVAVILGPTETPWHLAREPERSGLAGVHPNIIAQPVSTYLTAGTLRLERNLSSRDDDAVRTSHDMGMRDKYVVSRAHSAFPSLRAGHQSRTLSCRRRSSTIDSRTHTRTLILERRVSGLTPPDGARHPTRSSVGTGRTRSRDVRRT